MKLRGENLSRRLLLSKVLIEVGDSLQALVELVEAIALVR